MIQQDGDTEDLWARFEVEPEPSPEELLAILEVLRNLESDIAPPERGRMEESRWQLAARREGMRSAVWPPQSVAWENTRR